MNNATANVLITANANQANREFEGFAAKAASTSAVVRSSMGGIGGAVEGLRGQFAALTGVISVGVFAAVVKHQIDLTDEAGKAAQAVGLQIQVFRELAYAADLSGVGQEALTKALARLGAEMTKAADGDLALQRLFGQTLGVKVRDAAGALRATDEVLGDVAERFATMEDGPRKTALAMEVFGQKAGPQLIPLLNSGRDGIAELREEFRKLNGVTTEDNRIAAEAFNDNMSRLKQAAAGFSQAIANTVLPTLVEFSSFAVKAAKDVGLLEAAWLSFGKVVARLTGNDEAGQLQSNYRKAQAEVTHLQRLLQMAQNQLEMAPKDPALRQTVQGLTADIMRANEQVKLSIQAIDAYEKALKAESAPAPKAPASTEPTGDLDLSPAKAADTRMAAWEAELARRRAAYATSQQAIGSLRELGKQDEADYWGAILRTLGKADAQRTAVELRYLSLQADVRREAFEAKQAELQTEIDAAKFQASRQAELAREYVANAREKFGAESKEYQAALKVQQKLERAHEEARQQLYAVRLQRESANRLEELDFEDQIATQRMQRLEISERQMLEVRARTIAARRQIEEDAKLAEIAAMKDGPHDPVAVEKLEAELDAIRRRYRTEATANQGQQQQAAGNEQATALAPFERIFGVSEDVVQQGLQSMVEKGKITLGGLRDATRQIGSAMIQELITRPMAQWITSKTREVLLTALFGKQKVAMEAATQGQITAVQGASSVKTIAMKGYEAAAGAYAAIAGIPYVGPVLAPIAAGVALAGVMAFASRIFSAEGGFDIGPGINPVVQAHANEMVLPAKHADTIRMLGDMFASGGASGPPGGNVQFNAIPMPGGWFMAHQDELIAVFKQAKRNFRI